MLRLSSFWYVWDLPSRPWPETKCLCRTVAGCVTVTWSRHLCHASGTKSPATRAEGQLEQVESQRIGCAMPLTSNRSNRSFSISNSTGMIFLLHSSRETVSPTNMSPIPKSLDHFEMFTSCCFFSRCPCHQPTPHHPLQHLPVGSWKAVHRSTEWSRACLRQEGQLSALLRHSALHSATLCTIQISLA